MKNLIAALEQQLKLLEELHGLLQKETSELSDVHLDAMAAINLQKEDIAARIAAHAEVLLREMKASSAREGLPATTTLGMLAARFSQKGNGDLLKLHSNLNSTATQVKQLLALNRDIAERFAASIGNSLDILTRVMNQSNTYGASGGYQQRLTSSVLINREA